MALRYRVLGFGLLCVVILIINGLAQLKNFNLATKTIYHGNETFRQVIAQSSNLRIIPASQFADETGFDCLEVAIDSLRFPVCAYYPQDDILISHSLYKGEYYEIERVKKLIRLFKKHENVTFVDLGANIGLYSLPIAHLGIHVVAVEPNPETFRRLAKSIHLGGVSSRVAAVKNAVTDIDQSVAVLQIDLLNRGNSSLTEDLYSPCDENCSVVVPTTTLDRLLPLMKNRQVVIKVDVQGSEIKVFTETGAGLFFKTVDVPIVMMEWQTYRKYYKDESTRRVVYRLLDFFYSLNYDVYDARTEKKLTVHWWKDSPQPHVISFKKRGLPTDDLYSI